MPHIKPTPTPTYKTPLTAWAIALSLALTACGGGSSSTATPTPTPTPSGTPSATPTPSGTPSATPTPSGTPSATPTPSGTPAAAPTPTPTAAECPFGNYKAELQAAINLVRASSQSCLGYTNRRTGQVIPANTYGPVGGLTWNSQLESAAARHSTDMAVVNFFDHTGSDGSTVTERAPAAGYVWQSIGENIAASAGSVSTVVDAWMKSDKGHCENIMNVAHVDIGASCKYSASSTYGDYWTLVMGKR